MKEKYYDMLCDLGVSNTQKLKVATLNIDLTKNENKREVHFKGQRYMYMLKKNLNVSVGR